MQKAKTKLKAPKQHEMETIDATIVGATKKGGDGGEDIEDPPSQESMDGEDVDIDKPAENFYKSKTTLNKDITFFEAMHWCGCLDALQRQCTCCCGYREYTVSNDGLKVRDIRPCSEAVNNVDWSSFESVDYETGCCYGYLELNTRDAECGDMVLRVRKDEGEKLADVLFNLSAGEKRDAKTEVILEAKEACHCCDPCAFLTTFTVTKRALKLKRSRCLPCLGYEARNLRYLTKHGTDNIVDIDSAMDCCYGYVYVYTNDPKPEFQHLTMRLSKGNEEAMVSELRKLNSSAAGRETRAVTSFRETGCCYGCFDPCTPGFCRAFDTQYLVTENGLTMQNWSPCRSSANFVAWDRVLDLDMETTCCLGFLDMHYFDQDSLHNTTLKIEKKRVDELYETVQKLRSYKAGQQDDAIFNHFREAEWCDSIWRMCDSCSCPTRYVLKRTGMEVTKTKCGCCQYGTSVDHMKWDRVRDVDYETDCCFGYVLMETWDDELGDMKLRVRKAQAEKLACQIHNRSLGKGEDKEFPELAHFQRAGCCNCLSCCSTNYILTESALKVRDNYCTSSRNNNIAWRYVRDVDGESTCCCAYIQVQSADRVVRDHDRSAKKDEDPKAPLKADGKAEKLEEVVLRVWPWRFEEAFRKVKNARKGAAVDEKNVTTCKYQPRGWFDFLTCYRGYCWFYHPVEYQVTKQGFQVKRTTLCSSRGPCSTSVNNIDWVQVREIDSSTSCCWATIDIKTLDEDDPHIVTRLLNSEIEDVINKVRGQGKVATE